MQTPNTKHQTPNRLSDKRKFLISTSTILAAIILASVVQLSFVPAPAPPGLTYTFGHENDNGTPLYRLYIETWGTNGLIGPTQVYGNIPTGTITYTMPLTVAHIRGVRVYCSAWNAFSTYWNACGAYTGGCSSTTCGPDPYCYDFDHISTNGFCMDNGWLRIGTD